VHTTRRTETSTRAPSFNNRFTQRPDLKPAHNRCLRLADATPAATRKRRRSAARGTGWPRNRCNWCGRSATHAVFAVGTRITARPPHRSVRARFRHTAPTSVLSVEAARQAKDAECVVLAASSSMSLGICFQVRSCTAGLRRISARFQVEHTDSEHHQAPIVRRHRWYAKKP